MRNHISEKSEKPTPFMGGYVTDSRLIGKNKQNCSYCKDFEELVKIVQFTHGPRHCRSPTNDRTMDILRLNIFKPFGYLEKSFRMKGKYYLAFIAFLAFTVFSTTVHAIGFGTVQKVFFANITQGETAESIILFWNIEDTPAQIEMSVRQTPDNWIVKIRPERFLLNKSKIGPPYDDGEYIGLPGIGDVKTLPVRIIASVPKSANPGSYDVLVTARLVGSSSGIAAVQERTFKLAVDVKKAPTFFETLGKTLTDASNKMMTSGREAVNKFIGMFSSIPIDFRIIFLILSVIIILAISWVIYKYV